MKTKKIEITVPPHVEKMLQEIETERGSEAVSEIVGASVTLYLIKQMGDKP